MFQQNNGLGLMLLLLVAFSVLNGRPQRDPIDIACVLISFVIAITIHEFMHAYTAHRLGDDTALRLGRVTFNPIAHFDPIGFFGMFMIALGFPFIGWGKPVPVQPGNFRGSWSRNRKKGMFLVTAAGPASNVIQAAVAAVAFQIMVRQGQDWGNFGRFIQWFMSINVLLAAFNMIPVPPLDGYRLLSSALPDFWSRALRPLEQYGFMILMLFMFVGGQMGDSLLSGMIRPVQDALFRLLTIGLT